MSVSAWYLSRFSSLPRPLLFSESAPLRWRVPNQLPAKNTPAKLFYLSVVYCHNQVDVRIGKQSLERNFNTHFYKKKCSSHKFELNWPQKNRRHWDPKGKGMENFSTDHCSKWIKINNQTVETKKQAAQSSLNLGKFDLK